MDKVFIASLLLMFSGGTMASSQVLPSAESLSGQWTLSEQSNACVIHLAAASVKSANGYQLTIAPDCSTDLLPEAPEAWRPAPDGIALLNKEGSTLLFLSQEGDHYRSQIWQKDGKILKKTLS